MNGDGGDIVAGAAIFAAMSAVIWMRRHWRSALSFILKVAELCPLILGVFGLGALIGSAIDALFVGAHP